MKTYTDKLDELLLEAINKINDLIQQQGQESEYSHHRCLKIKDDDVMFNLRGGGRYVTEVANNILIDNGGMEYDYGVLSVDKIMTIVDYLIEEYYSPRYEHNCICCRYLGRYEKYDLYYCEESVKTVIARYGKDSDYISGLGFSDNHNNPLFVAKMRAEKLGLI